jgi:hypothetical protein
MTEQAPRGILDGLFRICEIIQAEGVPWEVAEQRWRETNRPPPPDNVIRVDFVRRTGFEQ